MFLVVSILNEFTNLLQRILTASLTPKSNQYLTKIETVIDFCESTSVVGQ